MQKVIFATITVMITGLVITGSVFAQGFLSSPDAPIYPGDATPGTISSLCDTDVNCPTNNLDDYTACHACLCGIDLKTGASVPPGTWTEFGCWNTSSISGFSLTIIRIVIGVFGGVLLLMLISAGYLYNTGQVGNIEAAKKRITAVIAAILLIVFSSLILRLVGVNVLDVVTQGVIG